MCYEGQRHQRAILVQDLQWHDDRDNRALYRISNEFLEELGRAVGGDQGSWWFHQDGANLHTSKLTGAD